MLILLLGRAKRKNNRIRDRVVFSPVGGALDHLLTSGRIDRIIRNHMRADLKWASYEAGLTKCIDAIVKLLERGKESSAFEFRSDNAIKIEGV